MALNGAQPRPQWSAFSTLDKWLIKLLRFLAAAFFMMTLCYIGTLFYQNLLFQITGKALFGYTVEFFQKMMPNILVPYTLYVMGAIPLLAIGHQLMVSYFDPLRVFRMGSETHRNFKVIRDFIHGVRLTTNWLLPIAAYMAGLYFGFNYSAVLIASGLMSAVSANLWNHEEPMMDEHGQELNSERSNNLLLQLLTFLSRRIAYRGQKERNEATVRHNHYLQERNEHQQEQQAIQFLSNIFKVVKYGSIGLLPLTAMGVSLYVGGAVLPVLMGGAALAGALGVYWRYIDPILPAINYLEQAATMSPEQQQLVDIHERIQSLPAAQQGPLQQQTEQLLTQLQDLLQVAQPQQAHYQQFLQIQQQLMQLKRQVIQQQRAPVQQQQQPQQPAAQQPAAQPLAAQPPAAQPPAPPPNPPLALPAPRAGIFSAFGHLIQSTRGYFAELIAGPQPPQQLPANPPDPNRLN